MTGVARGALDPANANNPLAQADAGNALHLREGYTIVWSGWDPDAPKAGNGMSIRVPVATRDGQPRSGFIPAPCQAFRTNTQHEDHLYPENRFPFSAARSSDPLTGRAGALLRGDGFDPLLIDVNTSTEYWQKGASLLHTAALAAVILICRQVHVST